MDPTPAATHQEVPTRPVKAAAAEAAVTASTGDFDGIYEEHVDFVWRNLRRLGVSAAQLDDACQDVFLVVHRRRGDFAGRSTIRTWLFGIVLRVASEHRRKGHRAAVFDALDDDLRSSEPGPFELASRREAVRLLERFLGMLSDSTRPVFILAELEQMTAPAIAEALSLNLNTVYSRLRLARQAFEREVAEWTRRGGRP
jgi:RNA polymerase sigma-70 factor (ECF subfamily)